MVSPGAPYDESRLAQEGLADKPYVNPSDDRLPWEANPVALSGRVFVHSAWPTSLI